MVDADFKRLVEGLLRRLDGIEREVSDAREALLRALYPPGPPGPLTEAFLRVYEREILAQFKRQVTFGVQPAAASSGTGSSSAGVPEGGEDAS